MENENYGLGDTAANVRDRVSDFGNKAADTAAKAADTAKSRVAAIGEGIEHAAAGVRDRFDDTVEYFREQGINDVTKYVKSHPVQALVAALALGFVAGQLLRRD